MAYGSVGNVNLSLPVRLILLPKRYLLRRRDPKKNKRRRNKMVEYKCFDCNKRVSKDYIRKRVRCPYCGGKILFKPRTVITKVKAR